MAFVHRTPQESCILLQILHAHDVGNASLVAVNMLTANSLYACWHWQRKRQHVWAKNMASTRQRPLLHWAFNVFTFNIPELNGEVCLLSLTPKAINIDIGQMPRSSLLQESWSKITLLPSDGLCVCEYMNHALDLLTTKCHLPPHW